MMMICF